MSEESFIDKNKDVIIFAIALTIFFELTKPENEQRPHWTEFYSYTIFIFLICNLFLMLSASYVHYQLPFNIGYSILIFIILVIKVNNDLSLVQIDRKSARHYAKNEGVIYHDPYGPHWPRRFLIGFIFWLLHLLWGDVGINQMFTISLVGVMVVLYGVRDFLYMDCSASVFQNNKVAKPNNITSARRHLK